MNLKNENNYKDNLDCLMEKVKNFEEFGNQKEEGTKEVRDLKQKVMELKKDMNKYETTEK